MSANDELQAHTCEKMLEFYGDVANNVAQGKVQDLTEQWKKGKLSLGTYYAKMPYGNIEVHSDYSLYRYRLTKDGDGIEVLAPVPSYDEWQKLKEEYVDKYDKYLRLSTTNHQLRKIIEEFNTLDVAKENQQLKELLKECKYLLDEYDYTFNCDDCAKSCRLTNLIDNAIGENNAKHCRTSESDL